MNRRMEAIVAVLIAKLDIPLHDEHLKVEAYAPEIRNACRIAKAIVDHIEEQQGEERAPWPK